MRGLLRRVWYLLRHRQLEDELEEELTFHREMMRQALEQEGVAADRVAVEAQRALGNDALARNHARDVWVWPWLQDISQDIRFAARLLAKERRFTLAAVVALALGIGVTNTVFTIVNTAMFRDLPFDEPERLISIQTQTTRGQGQAASFAEYRDWRDATTTFAGIGASAMAPLSLVDEGLQPERLRGAFVSANTFRLLRVAPLLGRDFLPEDDRAGAPAVVIISYGVWQGLYGGDAAVIGRYVRINDVPSTIVGVMPPRFGFPAFQDLWQPLALLPGLDMARRDVRRLSVFGRLTDAADLPRARAEIDTIVAQLAREYPDTNKDTMPSVMLMRDRLALPSTWPILVTLMVAVGFVLLVACANVASLLLARSVNRSREIAIRASLGATRWRIVRQLLIECMLIATLAGALGLLLSVYGVTLLGVAFDAIEIAAPAQSNTPYWVDLSMNWLVFLFVGALCLVTGLAFGLVPALHISKTDVNDTLKDGGRGGIGGRHARRWTGAFVTAQLALTLILLSAAGLLWRNFLTTYRADVIVDASELVTMRLALSMQKYSTPELVQRFHEHLDERLVGRSDLLSATIASYIPYSAFLSSAPQGSSRQVAIEGHVVENGMARPSVQYVVAGPRYFETIGLPLARGRGFTARDELPAQAGAIVDERFATMFFGGEDPLGRRIQVSTGGAESAASPWLTIVGVVPTLVQYGPGRPAVPVVYVPLRLEPAPRIVGLMARRSRSDERATGRHLAIGNDPRLTAIVSAIRDEVRALDADLPVFAVETMDTALARSRFANRLIGTWFGMLASIALVLASVGLYALTAHSVASRTQEIGIRMALGAQTSEVVWMFVRRSVAQLAVGVTLGLAGALATGQLLHTWLTRTDPLDGLTLAVVSTTLILVSIVACFVPARRAARLDPVIALRND